MIHYDLTIVILFFSNFFRIINFVIMPEFFGSGLDRVCRV